MLTQSPLSTFSLVVAECLLDSNLLDSMFVPRLINGTPQSRYIEKTLIIQPSSKIYLMLRRLLML